MTAWKVADVFVDMVGRELSPDALKVLMPLQRNGSRALASELLSQKRYMTTSSDLTAFIKEFSPASHAKDMIAAQTEARAAAMKGV